MVDKWQPQLLKQIQCPLTTEWLNKTGQCLYKRFPTANQLNQIAHPFTRLSSYKFVDQNELEQDEYYEMIIARDNIIPTRADNWHDYLNAQIWMQFPRSKALISGFHARDIEQHGLHPRTKRRNRLTHFDECGVVLACNQDTLDNANKLIYALATHQWQQAFVDLGHLWFKQVYPVVFGHALLEMQLSPFIGMTGKWLAVVVDASFGQASPEQKRSVLDVAISNRLGFFDGLQQDDVLRPIPVLGVPGWHPEQHQAFYTNQDYFRVQRSGVPITRQYPLLKIAESMPTNHK